MRPIEYKRYIRELRKACAARSIGIEVIKRKGSHRGLVFTDNQKPDRSVHTTVVEHDNISPGVQRDMIDSMKTYPAHGAHADLAAIVSKIMEEISNRGR